MQALNSFIQRLHEQNRQNSLILPDKYKTQRFVDNVIETLFPTGNTPPSTDEYELLFGRLQWQLAEILQPLHAILPHNSKILSELFFDALPHIYEQLLDDAQAIYRFDPAAYSLQEVVGAYPGFYAIAVYRLSHQLWQLQIPILPRLVSEYAHSKTGIDIHPGASIGNCFFIDHGTGIVIGETTTIGNEVKIYQGVTLGALNVEKDLAQKKRHPTIEDRVIIYAGSTILGGNTVVGRDSIIGGSVWLTESIPAFSLVYHKSQVRVRNTKDYIEPIDFVI
jgi:serine O-acetyltransferase